MAIYQHPQALTALPRRRIVSLVPSITELLAYLELDEQVLGITKFCVHPEHWYRNKVRIGGTKNLNLDRILALEPDLVLANQEENEAGQVQQLARHTDVWLTRVANLADARQMISTVGRLCGRSDAAENLQLQIGEAFRRLRPLSPALPCAYLIWQNPYMTAGGDTFIGDMLRHCGLQNVYDRDTRYPLTSPQELSDRGTRVLLLSSEPFPFAEKHRQQWAEAHPEMRAYLVDGTYFSWYGSRLLQAPAYFQQLIAAMGQTG